jgi:hypothetical protein
LKRSILPNCLVVRVSHCGEFRNGDRLRVFRIDNDPNIGALSPELFGSSLVRGCHFSAHAEMHVVRIVHVGEHISHVRMEHKSPVSSGDNVVELSTNGLQRWTRNGGY